MAKEPQAHDETPDLQTQVNAMMAELTMLRSAVKSSATANGLDGTQLEQMFIRVAQISAEAQERAANPSNKNYPRISVFSHPEGDRLHERVLKCPMRWAGEDISLDTTTAEEIDLMNLAEPGTYTFKRTTGRPEQLTITADRGPAGEVQRLSFEFPRDKETRDTLPSISGILRSAFRVASPEEAELERLRAQLAAMQAASGMNVVTA